MGIVIAEIEASFDEKIIIACLRIIGNISSNGDDECEYLLSLGIIPIFHQILRKNKSKFVRRDIIWIYSNLGSGNMIHVNLLLAENNLVK